MVVENTVPAIVGPIDKNLIWLINYEKELQGLLITDSCEVESPYYTIHSALLNTYVNYNYAIFILEGYMMAIIKQLNDFYIFDSHARDLNGMPDPNGTAVVIKFSNISDLEQFLYYLSKNLHVNLFEVVLMYVTKTNFRLNKDTAKRNQSQVTENKQQARLEKDRESKKQKRLSETDSEQQLRLENDRQSKRQKRLNETENERQSKKQARKVSASTWNR